MFLSVAKSIFDIDNVGKRRHGKDPNQMGLFGKDGE